MNRIGLNNLYYSAIIVVAIGITIIVARIFVGNLFYERSLKTAGDVSKRTRYLKTAIEYDPWNWKYYDSLGRLFHKQHDNIHELGSDDIYEQARQYYRKALDLNPLKATTRLRLALINYEMTRNREQLAEALRVLEILDPVNPLIGKYKKVISPKHESGNSSMRKSQSRIFDSETAEFR